MNQQLTLSEVIKHYGFKADKHNRICCPFHDDKTLFGLRCAENVKQHKKNYAFQCYTKDGGRSSGGGLQEQPSNRLS